MLWLGKVWWKTKVRGVVAGRRARRVEWCTKFWDAAALEAVSDRRCLSPFTNCRP